MFRTDEANWCAWHYACYQTFPVFLSSLYFFQFRNMVTHTGKLFSLKSVSFEWQSPVQFEGQIIFRATVVQDYSTFWKDVESALVNVSNPYADKNFDELPRQQRHSQDFVPTSKIEVENSTGVLTLRKKAENDYNDSSSCSIKLLPQSFFVFFVLLSIQSQ